MKTLLRTCVLFALILPSAIFGQVTNTTGTGCPGVPGACGYHHTTDPNTPSVAHTDPNQTPQNGNGTLGNIYANTACGLNFSQASQRLGQRFSPIGVAQPAPFVISGIPSCATVVKAFLWAEGSGNGAAQTATINGPFGTGNYPMAIVGQGPDKCWGYAGSYTYRADVTPTIGGNGTYNISGILTNPPTSGNDMDGATLIVIWTDPTQTYQGTIRIDDGAMVVNGGVANYNMTYPAICGATTNGTAFFCIGDIQFNPTSWSANSTPCPLSWNWWNYVSTASPFAVGQTTSNFNVNTGGDCFNLCVTGIYYRTTCTTCTPTSSVTLTTSSTPATCSACNGSASVTVSPAGAYTYSWSPSGGTGSSATNLCAGTYTVTVTSSCGTATAAVTVGTSGGSISTTGAQTNVTCNGTCNGSATVTVTSGTGPFTYSWTPSGGTGSTASGLCAGTYTCTVTGAGGCTGTQTFNITQPPAITNTSSQVNLTCNGVCNGSASVVASGGNGTYTYSWSPSGGTGATASSLCAGTYTCTISSPAGCTHTQTFNITQPPPITLTPSQVNVTCNGACNGSATVVAAGGNGTYTYSWAPTGGTGATASGLCAGTYTVTVSSPAGCSVTQSFNITQPPVITLTQSQVNVTCNGTCNGSATVVASGGTGTYTYSWAPSGGSSATAGSLCAGTYTVTVSSPAGCTATASFNITQPPPITATPSQVNVTCNGACNGSATVVAAGGNGTYSYSWAPSGGTGPTASSLCAGTYTCTISSPAGCSITQTFNITQPPAITNTQSQVNVNCNGSCNGSATVVAAGGNGTYTYAWTPTGGTGATASSLCAGTYTCTISSPAGCTHTATFNITQPAAITSSATTVPATCGNPNGSATVTAAGGTPAYTYSWAPTGGSAATATGLTAGSYTCTITDANGCTHTQTVSITNAGSPTATITSSTNVTCFGGATGSATVSASGGTGPYTYAWTPTGGTGTTASGLTAQSYTCTVTDANGCITTASVTITQNPQITSTQSQVDLTCNAVCNGSATVVASGGTGTYTYAWSPSGGTGPTASSLCAGTYTCTISSPAGCTATATFNITQPPAITATTSQVNVTCNGSCNGSATVTASGGNGTYSYSWAPSGGTGATASGLCAGTYTCTISSPAGCSITASFNITQPTPITATTSNTTSTCGSSNGSATVTPSGGTPGYTYSWSPVAGSSATLSNLPAGAYTCVVTDAAGCTATFVVNVPNAGSPAANITASSNVTCYGACDGSATVTGSGGTPPYTYAWSPSGGTGSTASSLCPALYTATLTDANGCIATATVNITQPPQITAVTTQVDVTCNALCNGSATVTASGGNGTYTYSWAPSGGTGATASSLCAGTYTCTISSPAGCTATATVNITEPAALTISGTQVDASCNGSCDGSATVIVGGGTPTYTYAWAPTGGTGATATGLCAGSFTCTATDANGCTVTQTFTIAQPAPLTATTAFVQSTCGNANGSATATPAGGTGPYTYSWNSTPVQTTATATGLLSGSYTCTISDSHSCTITATVNVPNAGSPTATIIAFTNVTCNGACDGTATVSASGGTGPYTYSWLPSGGTGTTATNLCPGTYTITLMDANGCSATATVTITEPTPVASTGTQIDVTCNALCNGSATTMPSGGTPGYSYSWTPSGGTGATATALCATNYSCTITDANGCVATQTFLITQPTPLTATPSQTDVTCNAACDGTATVVIGGGTPGYTYSWAPTGGTGATATALCAGNYTVTATDANGCSITQTYLITEPTPLTATSSFVQSTCGNPNGSATVTPSGGTPVYNCVWNTVPVQSGVTATGLMSGAYVCTITDANGCSITVNVTVPNAGNPIASILSFTNVTCNGACNGTATGDAIGGTGPYTYSWLPSGGNNANATGLCPGVYTVTATDANGCTSTATVAITEPPVLTISGTQTDVSCNAACDGTATVTVGGGTPGYTYSWAPSGGTGATATALCAGTYTCTVSDANNCTITQTFDIIEPTPLTVAAAGFNVTCYGVCDGQIVAIPSGGTPNYSFVWSTGCTSPSCNNICAGTYTITVSDSHSCTATATATVTEPTQITFSTSSQMAHCNQADGCANVINAAGGTGNIGCAWTTGPTTMTWCGVAPGTYTFTLTDANGCDTTSTVNVGNIPGVTSNFVSSTNVTCNGACDGTAVCSTIAGTGTITYAWTPSGGNALSASSLCNGTYTFTATDSAGCTDTTVVNITQPAPLSVSATANPAAVCAGTPLTVSATSTGGTQPTMFNWPSIPGTGASQTYVPSATGPVTVIGTDANGCVDSTSVIVTVNPLPVVQFIGDSLSGCAPLCVNFTDQTTVSSGSFSGWLWDFGDGNTSNLQNPQHCYANSGTYNVTLTVTTSAGCAITLTMTNYITVYPNPVADFTASPQPTTELDPTIYFTDASSGNSSWSWSFGDGSPTSSVQNPSYTYPAPGCYGVVLTVTTVNGCWDTATQVVCIDPDVTLYVPNAFTPDGDGNNDNFIPQGIGIDPDKFEMWIFDRWGNMIFYTDDFYQGWNGKVQGHEEICQIDTYVWKIKAVDIKGGKHNLIGKVSLIK